MHPLKLLFPLRGDIVFHVTNNGCSSSLGGAVGDGCRERRLPKLKKEVFDEDLEVLSKVALEEVAEREEEDAEAGDGAWRRDILGRESFEGAGWTSSSGGSSSSSSDSSSSSSGPPISLSPSSGWSPS